jgi:hypothetical protein
MNYLILLLIISKLVIIIINMHYIFKIYYIKNFDKKTNKLYRQRCFGIWENWLLKKIILKFDWPLKSDSSTLIWFIKWITGC